MAEPEPSIANNNNNFVCREKGGSYSITKKSTSTGSDRCLFPVSPDSGAEGGGEVDSDDTFIADTPQDIAVLPGYQLLSPEEIQVQLFILPKLPNDFICLVSG